MKLISRNLTISIIALILVFNIKAIKLNNSNNPVSAAAGNEQMSITSSMIVTIKEILELSMKTKNPASDTCLDLMLGEKYREANQSFWSLLTKIFDQKAGRVIVKTEFNSWLENKSFKGCQVGQNVECTDVIKGMILDDSSLSSNLSKMKDSIYPELTHTGIIQKKSNQFVSAFLSSHRYTKESNDLIPRLNVRTETLTGPGQNVLKSKVDSSDLLK